MRAKKNYSVVNARQLLIQQIKSSQAKRVSRRSFLKRAWTKKVKSLPSCAVAPDALERQLQSQPKIKRRLFRTSATIIGLTVSVGMPNLLLTQAAQVPGSISNTSSETEQKTQAIAPTALMPLPMVIPPQVAAPPRQKADIPSYNQPEPVVQSSTPEVNFTQKLQPSSQVEAQASVVKRDVAALLKQHQQSLALEQVQAVDSLTATPTSSQTQRLIAQLKSSEQANAAPHQAVEIVPTQIDTAFNSSEVQQQVAVSSEANSAWTAKQRLLIDRLKGQENNSAPVSTEVIPAPNNIELASPITTTSQPVELSAPKIEVANPKQAPAENLANDAPEIVTTSNDDTEFAAPPLPTETIVLPATAPTNQEVTNPQQIAQPLPQATAETTQLSPTLQPVFVLPASVAQEANTTLTAGEVEAQQVATQNSLQAVEAKTSEAKTSTPNIEVATSVNEPIIESSTTLEYQVKPGDTLTNIASIHHLSLPEIANFNQLSNPDLLLVDQKIKLPSLTSRKTQASVAVLPPIEKIESLAEPALQSSNKVVLVATEQKTVQPQVYTGVGGNIAESDAEAKPLEQTTLDRLQAQYAQRLQNDVQKLQRKYYAQNNSSKPIVPVQAIRGEVLQRVIKPNLILDDEPINPEFRVAQTSQDLKSAPQKRLLNKVDYSAPATVRGKVATAPVNIDNAEEFAGQQVTPELPPLDPAFNYLPQPSGVAPFNGYIWPAKGALTSKYGWRWGRMHRGIDIAAPVGTPIYAAAPGVVIKSGWNRGGYGNLVDIQHSDGTLTRYAHNYRLLVQPGQFVEQGQQISLMGSTGRSTGPHLHFEVHPGGKGAVNPIALLPKSR
jgi:murein DD-endopeptidase MepM/ murein hydrolase activator NlpD